MRFSFQAIFLLLACGTGGVAQDAGSQPSWTMGEPCTEEVFEQAERSFEKRVWSSENLAMAERLLSKVLLLCEEYPASLQAREQLKVVHEEFADHYLRIALFYLRETNDGKGGKAAAVSRLKIIIERYPEYSKLDQVLFLLGETNMNDRNFNEAAGYYQKLLRAYPVSKYIGEASMRLCALDLLKTETIEPTIP